MRQQLDVIPGHNATLDFHLNNWARWKRHGGGPQLGYSQLPGVSGSISFDDMTRQMDREHAASMDLLIENLPTLEKGAIHHVYLGTRYDLELHLTPALERAFITLNAGMADKEID